MEAKEYEIMQKLEGEHWWFVARRKVIAAMLSQLNLPANAQVLEIGCGSGGNLKMLSQFGEVYGVEPNDKARASATAKGLAKAIEKAKLPAQIPFSDKKFDLIVLLDALEHIEEDTQALKVLHGSLKDSGILFITVPAFKFLWSAHDVSCHHKRRYNKASLRKVLADAGFKEHYVSYFNFWLFPVVLTVRMVNKLLGVKDQSDLKMPGKFMNKLLTGIFASERILIGKISFLFGVSLMLAAKK